jgi:hypothetical protein
MSPTQLEVVPALPVRLLTRHLHSLSNAGCQGTPQARTVYHSLQCAISRLAVVLLDHEPAVVVSHSHVTIAARGVEQPGPSRCAVLAPGVD